MKKLLAATLLLAVLLSISLCAFAHSSWTNTPKLSVGETYEGLVYSANLFDVVQFHLDKPGIISISYVGQGEKATVMLYSDDKLTRLEKVETTQEKRSTLQKATITRRINAGTYYIEVRGAYGTNLDIGSAPGEFTLSYQFQAGKESFIEDPLGSDNSFLTANTIKLNKTYYGQFTKEDDIDYYTFFMDDDDTVYLNAISHTKGIHFFVYDSEGNELYRFLDENYDSKTGKNVTDHALKLSYGVNYISVACYDEWTGTITSYTTDYEFILLPSSEVTPVPTATPKPTKPGVTATPAPTPVPSPAVTLDKAESTDVGTITVQLTANQPINAYVIGVRKKSGGSWNYYQYAVSDKNKTTFTQKITQGIKGGETY